MVTEGKSSVVMTKNKITAVDHENRKITHTVIEGDLAIGYPSFAAAFHITPIQGGGSNKSMVKWSVEYEKENEDVPAPTSFMKLMDGFFKELDAKLVEEA
ncbi:hypothetical protein MKW94_018981 [Papaver nudicaule]|uniref:Bet v I/Major latex protein domain-containing protein n=1 Tax=Papaver nudicaule TaxID=74823 RepID=A0AA41S8I4_PAPNU|nr:hypothetical protein [Papaver nudicaule]